MTIYFKYLFFGSLIAFCILTSEQKVESLQLRFVKDQNKNRFVERSPASSSSYRIHNQRRQSKSIAKKNLASSKRKHQDQENSLSRIKKKKSKRFGLGKNRFREVAAYSRRKRKIATSSFFQPSMRELRLLASQNEKSNEILVQNELTEHYEILSNQIFIKWKDEVNLGSLPIQNINILKEFPKAKSTIIELKEFGTDEVLAFLKTIEENPYILRATPVIYKASYVPN